MRRRRLAASAPIARAMAAPFPRRAERGTLPDRCGLLDDGDDRPELLVGPLLRYVDERRATIWVETDRACEVAVLAAGAPARRADVVGPRPPLRARRARGPPAEVGDRVPGRARRPRGVAGRRIADAAERHPHAGPRRAVPALVRQLPPLGAVRRRRTSTSSAPTPSSRWPARMVDRTARRVARPPAAARRPGLRRRSVRRDPRSAAGGQPASATRRSPTRSRTSRSTPGCTTRRGRRRPCAGCCRRCPTGMLLDDHDLRDDWNTSLVVAPGDHGQAVVARPGHRRLRARTGCTSTSAT